MFNIVMDRLRTLEGEATLLRLRNKSLADDNDFLRSNIRDLETRNRELVLDRVKMSFSDRLSDRTLHFHLAIDSMALMYARDPRMIVEGAFRRIGGELGHFFKQNGERL